MASESSSVERCLIAFEPIHCPKCHEVAVVKYGKTSEGKQRFRCHNPACKGVTFIHHDTYQGSFPEVKRMIVDMSLNGSGIRDIARVLHVSPRTVIHELKKEPQLQHVNVAACHQLATETAEVEIHKVEAAEIDEM